MWAQTHQVDPFMRFARCSMKIKRMHLSQQKPSRWTSPTTFLKVILTSPSVMGLTQVVREVLSRRTTLKANVIPRWQTISNKTRTDYQLWHKLLCLAQARLSHRSTRVTLSILAPSKILFPSNRLPQSLSSHKTLMKRH